MDAHVQEKVRISRENHNPRDRSLTISGLTEDELKRCTGVTRGQWWMRVEDGRLQFSSARKPLPAPTEDSLLPHWREAALPQEGEPRYQLTLFGDGDAGAQTPSIIIQHLCGYNYAPEYYKEVADFLEECGFACLRSRRGDDGQFWEIWFLPGLWAAKARLREALYGVPEGERMQVAMRFLAEQSSFGALDIAIQRMCQVIE